MITDHDLRMEGSTEFRALTVEHAFTLDEGVDLKEAYGRLEGIDAYLHQAPGCSITFDAQ